MLPEEVWKMPRLGTFNLHASLLPQYRGAAPINWAIINGEKMTGVTTFMLDKNIDTGGIILREECRIESSDDAGTLHDKLMAMGCNIVCDTAELLIQRNVELRTQRSFVQGSEVLRPAPKLTRENTRIDWNRTSTEVRNLVRGLSPYPVAYTELALAGEVSVSPDFATLIPPTDKSAGPSRSCGHGRPQSGETDTSPADKRQLKIFKVEKISLEQKLSPGQIYSNGKDGRRDQGRRGKHSGSSAGREETYGCAGVPCRIPQSGTIQMRMN